MEKRWALRLTGVAQARLMSARRQRQFHIIKTQIKKGDRYLKRLYKMWFFIGCVRLSIFRMIGQVVRVDIDEDMFGAP